MRHFAAYLPEPNRSEEHTSELQSPLSISYAVFCLKKKKKKKKIKKKKKKKKKKKFFFFNDTATTEIYTSTYTLSLHDALPICYNSRSGLKNQQGLDELGELALCRLE